MLLIFSTACAILGLSFCHRSFIFFDSQPKNVDISFLGILPLYLSKPIMMSAIIIINTTIAIGVKFLLSISLRCDSNALS